MPYLMQMMGCAVALVGLLLVIWLGFWMIVLMLVLSAFYAAWRYLVNKGIVNETPGVRTQETVVREQTATIIEGEYQQVEEEKRN